MKTILDKIPSKLKSKWMIFVFGAVFMGVALLCKKTFIDKPQQLTLSVVAPEPLQRIGDWNRTGVDMAVIQLQQGWNCDTCWEGLQKLQPKLSVNIPKPNFDDSIVYGIHTGDDVLEYRCAIANYGQPSTDTISPFTRSTVYNDLSNSDFVVKRSQDGVSSPAWGGSYAFYGLVDADVYFKGERVGNGYKKIYDIDDGGLYIPTSFFALKYPKQVRYYSSTDTMALHPGYDDLYTIKLTLPKNTDGLFAVIGSVNPRGQILERDCPACEENNYAILPFRRTGNMVEIDQAAIAANKPVPVTNIIAVKKLTGSDKTVAWTWSSTHKEFKIHIEQKLTNGINMIDQEVYGNAILEHVPGNWKESTITVIATVDLLGDSSPVSFNVKK